MHISDRRLTQLIDRLERIEAQLACAADAEEITRLSCEYSALQDIARLAGGVRSARTELHDAETLAHSHGDPELSALARAEMAEIAPRLERLEDALRLALVPTDPDDTAGVVLEVRAGTGGEEAALFARDLFAMYTRYADKRGWRIAPISRSPSDVGGYREIIAAVEGDGVYGRWKHESGVHRVQRVPVTESGGRIHTSAATVAVLPAPEKVRDIEIAPQDIRIDTMRASGAGGQHVNKTDSAVRITHLPTGLAVTSSEKSQHYNRAQAMATLKARLYEKQRRVEQDARADMRRVQLGSGDRSERIRTYNFPQGRVSDHRINLSVRRLEEILVGEALDDIIEPLMAEEQVRRLAALEGDG